MKISVVGAGYIGLPNAVLHAQINDVIFLDPLIGGCYNNPRFCYSSYYLSKDTKQLLVNYRNVPWKSIHVIVEANTARKDFISQENLKRNPKLVGLYPLIMKAGSDNLDSLVLKESWDISKVTWCRLILFKPGLQEEAF